MSSNNSVGIFPGLKAPLAYGFLKNATLFPQRNALWIAERYYTYGELFSLVQAVYKLIPTENIHERIGIYCDDDVQTYASILAVNLYGAAYVPLNNKYPVVKNRNIVKEAEIKLMLASTENNAVDQIASEIKCVSTSGIYLAGTIDMNADPDISVFRKNFNSMAYVLFTSGSTGEPKGAEISNENVNHCFDFFYRNYKFNENDRFLQASELTFDFSVFSFFMPLNIGACCYVLSGDKVRFMKIIKMLQQHHITVLSMVPSILRFIENYMGEIILPALRYCFLSGDALYRDLAAKWSRCIPEGEIHNFYGTTETTIVCTRFIFDRNDPENTSNGMVHLGKPFEGMEMIIVDENNLPCEKGELAISGPQVIKGYLGKNSDPKFFVHDGKKYYKPGDLVSKTINGDLVFHGREDSQVKINGYRIELGEIELMITKLLDKKCVVIASRDERQMDQLTAFIETEVLDKDDLLNKLSAQLPEHIIPKRFEIIKNFSLSINGKVDKAALFKSISYA